MKNLPRLTAAFAIAAFIFHPPLAHAADPVNRLRLLAAVERHDGSAVLAGIDLDLARGWKTYWRRPGDSGIAPEFDWSESENVADIEMRWPAPERFDDPGDTTFGYREGVVWPLRVVPQSPDAPVVLRFSVRYGICADLCIPRESEISLDVPAAEEGRAAAETKDAAILRAALSRVPLPLEDSDRVTIGWRENAAPVLEVRLRGCGQDCEPPALIVDGPGGVWFGVPAVTREGSMLRYAMEAEVLSPAMIEGEEIELVFVGAAGAFTVHKKL
jgi:DsbC/DsbD-like thiol-disulfide interchange protein